MRSENIRYSADIEWSLILTKRSKAQIVQVTEKSYDQRLDNFLIRELKGIPRTRIYRIIRRGEVRVNKKRAKPETRLGRGDMVRVPPLFLLDSHKLPQPSAGLITVIERSILHEDDDILVLNKPAGLPVHLGTGISLGLIEAVRQIKPRWRDAELAHRLDRDTSGVLIVCKNAQSQRYIQGQFKGKCVEKRYHLLVNGQWPNAVTEVKVALKRVLAGSGERLVRVDPDGKPSSTHFKIIERFKSTTLLEAYPITGRTHQIRVHCQHAGYPILGDPKYGANTQGESVKDGPDVSAKYLCLHAAEIRFRLPHTDKSLKVSAPWGKSFAAQVSNLRKNSSISDS